MACYFTSWASYRKKEGKFVPEHLDPRLCTHIIYAFASLDPETLTIQPFDTWADIENSKSHWGMPNICVIESLSIMGYCSIILT